MGAAGEAIALAFLRRRGARFLSANRRFGRGEIDLLVEMAGRVVAVEVKTRLGVEPMSQVTRLKRERMHRVGRAAGVDRIDVVTVMFDRSGAKVRWVRGV